MRRSVTSSSRKPASALCFRRLPSFAALLDEPNCCWAADDALLCWSYDRHLHGLAFLGIPGDAAIRRLLELDVALRRRRNSPRRHVVADLRALHAVPPSAYGTLVEGARRLRGGHVVERLAIVRPRHILLHALVAGHLAELGMEMPPQLFDEPVTALTWLDPRHPTGLAAVMDDLVREATGLTPLVAAVRRAIRSALCAPTAPDIAAAVGLTAAALGTALRAQRTSLAKEVNTVRVLEIKRRLLMANEPLGIIATDIGCASLQHLTVLFTRAEGMSPTAWRRQQGGTDHSSDGGSSSAQSGLLASSSRMSKLYDGAPSSAHDMLPTPQTASSA